MNPPLLEKYLVDYFRSTCGKPTSEPFSEESRYCTLNIQIIVCNINENSRIFPLQPDSTLILYITNRKKIFLSSLLKNKIQLYQLKIELLLFNNL